MPDTWEFSIFDMVYLMLMLAGGAYCIVSYVRMKKGIFTDKNQIVIPSGCDAKRCKDMEGFKQYIGWRLMLLAIVLLCCGALQVSSTILVGMEILPAWTEQLLIIPVVIIIFWYIWSQKQAQSRFW